MLSKKNWFSKCKNQLSSANWLWHNKDIFLNIFYESHQDLSLLVTFLRHMFVFTPKCCSRWITDFSTKNNNLVCAFMSGPLTVKCINPSNISFFRRFLKSVFIIFTLKYHTCSYKIIKMNWLNGRFSFIYFVYNIHHLTTEIKNLNYFLGDF
jgi:hypothetical protein